MSSRYEVWSKMHMRPGKDLPVDTFYVIDTAIETATKLSRGTHEEIQYISTGKQTHFFDPFSTIPTKIEVPNAYAVVDRDGVAVIRGWAIGGKFHYATNCKRCSNSGLDEKGGICYSCHGSSLKPPI